MQIPVLLDRSSPEGLMVQIAEQLRESIRIGRIPSGARMPSSRRLAEQLGVSRNTVVRAYEVLEEQGFVEARAASGIFAATDRPDAAPPLAATDTPLAANLTAMPSPLAPAHAQGLLNSSGGRLTFDFFPGRPSASLFPIKTWRRLIHSSLSHGGALGLSQYSDAGGLFALRSAIAGHLAMSRGIVADARQIVVVTGIQEGLSIASRLFLSPDTRAVIENPCYQGAAFAFEATGAEIVRVPVDDDGLIVENLPARHASLVYTTPSHQYPVGSTLSLERRRLLVDWARRNGCYILEDDYDSDFCYEGSPLPAIASLAPDCTIYLGTFSKCLGAGLRLGYMVVPPALVDPVRASKTVLNNGNPWLEQSALADFIRNGSLRSHVMRMRTHYKERRDALIHALRRHFGDVDISGEACGLHLLWQLPPGVPEAAVLEAMARKARIGIYPLASGGALDALDTSLTKRGIILGYSSLAPNQIEQGIMRLSDLIDDALDKRPDSVGELLVHETIPLSRPRPAPKLRQKPALRAAPRHQALSPPDQVTEGVRSMQIVRGLYRYPVKGLSGEPQPGFSLEAGKPVPLDRVFALARPGVPVDHDDPKWAKKGLFLMLMLDEELARVRTSFDSDTSVLTAMDGDVEALSADLSVEEGRREVENFFRHLVPDLRDAPRLVHTRHGHFMDKPDNVISLINLATVRSLEEQWGFAIDPLRFRANIYVDGVRPWGEFEWVGSDIRIGDVVFRVDRRNGRCGATNVNPKTGQRDLDIPGSLRAAFGHKDLGVYLVARKGGKVIVGDPLVGPNIQEHEPFFAAPLQAAFNGQRRFICRGCYYIYEEARGHPPDGIGAGTAFSDVSPAWHCPDCGTDKNAFRPYVET